MSKKKVYRKTLPDVLAKKKTAVFHDDDFRKSWPTVSSLFTVAYTDDVITFEPCTIGISIIGGVMFARIHSKTDKTECRIPVPLPTMLWDALEEALNEGNVKWESDYDTKEKSRLRIDAPVD